MVLTQEASKYYDPYTNNCRHFQARFLAALIDRGGKALKILIAEQSPEGQLHGKHAMLGRQIAEGNPGSHMWFIEPQTGEIFGEEGVYAYARSLGIINPVVISL
jgi:hypothetical protein